MVRSQLPFGIRIITNPATQSVGILIKMIKNTTAEAYFDHQ
jgi:hypothetical protein